MSDAERLARVTLSVISEPGDPRVTLRASAYGGPGAIANILEETSDDKIREDLRVRMREVHPDAVLERASRIGLRFVIPGDPEWPVALNDLVDGPELHRRAGVPVGLWVRGRRSLAEMCEWAVAVVGSRSATTYGARAAADISAEVGQARYTVVSGAAFGIDQAAHRGALVAQAPTVAVMACGADRVYPSAHRNLIDYIAEEGAVVSEAAPGCAPTRIRFLARNRLIAAMTTGTVVVEAAVRSGALNTASWAEGVNRMVMGVPGPITSAQSGGVHQLIRSRNAVLVTNGAEVLDAVSQIGTFTAREPREEPRPRDLLTEVQRQVLDGVPVAQPVSTESVARVAGLRESLVGEQLDELREAGFVELVHGSWRLADREPRLLAPDDPGRQSVG